MINRSTLQPPPLFRSVRRRIDELRPRKQSSPQTSETARRARPRLPTLGINHCWTEEHAPFGRTIVNSTPAMLERDERGCAISRRTGGVSERLRRFPARLSSGRPTTAFEALTARPPRRRESGAIAGVQEKDIVSASIFTTQSATAILEKIRDQIKAATPAPADFNLGFDGTRTVFPLDSITGITLNQQTGDSPPRFTAAQPNWSLLRIIPGAVGQIALAVSVADYM